MVLSEAEIRDLLTKSYSASSVPLLQDYVLAVCRGEAPYIFDAVRTLVKLYQLFPTATTDANRKQFTGYACVLSMQHNNDLLALQFMIPKANVDTENPLVTASLRCSSLLDACLFIDFWKRYRESFLSESSSEDAKLIATMAKSAVPTLQQTILAILALSYKEAPLQLVLDSLDMTDAAAFSSIATGTTSVVESVTATTVIFAATGDNTKRQRVYQEGVSFPTVSALMQKMSTAQ